MTQILNLDGLSKVEREIKINNVVYPMKAMSVGDFIELSERAVAIEKSKKVEPLATLERVAFLRDTVAGSFPTCPREVLNTVTLDELNAIVDFARNGAIPDTAVLTQEGETKEDLEKSGDKKKST